LRLFGLADFFRAGYLAVRRRLRADRLRLLREQNLAKALAESLALLVAAATIGWMIWRAMLGMATLGDVALFYQAFQRGQGLVKALLTDIGQIYNNRLFLENLFDFLALEPRIVAPPKEAQQVALAEIREGIRFAGVTFRYPGTDRVALDRFDLTIPAGQTVAIVGANGAGKSTLLKLLCRFYDPDEGRVEFDGTDARRFDPAALRRLITVMFQAPVNYQATARENITIGDRRPDGAEGALTEGERRRMEGAAREAGAAEVVGALPQRYETLLWRLFPGGTELSGGEWQRLALARAYYRPSSLIILDEPTSMMDSWAESEWFAHFRRLAERSTAVIITHRLSIARKADVIHVMEHGRIVESGSHDELLALGGRYATSWNAQLEARGRDEREA
ncbi:MAG TPA: ABC transporter ATP-binding protein, partial [Gemmatimonadaceae bacterium]|nr:ABC transporter ATP-binding protein [Gemmatimonadaceae bacterium]